MLTKTGFKIVLAADGARNVFDMLDETASAPKPSAPNYDVSNLREELGKLRAEMSQRARQRPGNAQNMRDYLPRRKTPTFKSGI